MTEETASGEISGAAPITPPSVDWVTLPMSAASLPMQEEIRDAYCPLPLLAVAISGRGKRRFRFGLRSYDLSSSPGMVELYPAGLHLDHGTWTGSEPGEAVLIEFPATSVEMLLGSERALQLPLRHEIFDPRISDLVQMLRQEANAGMKLGPLYSQGLTLALISLLHEHGAVPRTEVGRGSIFCGRERLKLTEFVDQNLSTPISIEQLATLVSMSPDRFARGFRASFDQSPYAYVVERRVQSACRQLRASPDRSIAEIALACGFANQAHFTETFRRKIGTTPGRWRDENRNRGVGVVI